MLPAELDWLLDLLGFEWPNLDEDKMMEAAQTWRTFGQACQQCQNSGTSAANEVRSSNSGDAIEAFGEAWGKFTEDGLMGMGYLDALSDAAEILAALLDICAMIVLALKIYVIVQLIDLAIEFAIAQASAPITLGASEAALAGRVVMIRALVRRALTEAGQKIAAKVTEALEQKAVKSVTEILKDIGKESLIAVAKEGGKQIAQGKGANWADLGRAAVNPALKPVAGEITKDKDGEYGFKPGGLGAVAAGAYHQGEGLGRIAQGDVSGGFEKMRQGHSEAVGGARTAFETVTKDKPAPDAGGAPTPSPSGDERPAPARPTPAPTPAPPTTPDTPSAQAERERARNTFG